MFVFSSAIQFMSNIIGSTQLHSTFEIDRMSSNLVDFRAVADIFVRQFGWYSVSS
jgi:hypothetical protein